MTLERAPNQRNESLRIFGVCMGHRQFFHKESKLARQGFPRVQLLPLIDLNFSVGLRQQELFECRF